MSADSMAGGSSRHVNGVLKTFKTEISVVKHVHMISSIALVLIGVVILLGSIFVWTSNQDYEVFVKYYMNIPILALLIGGVITIALGWLGFIVAWQEHQRGIFTFFLLLSLLFTSVIISWVYFHYSVEFLNEKMLKIMKRIMNKYSFNSKNVDNLQEKLKCCGVNGYKDWKRILGYIPKSCYALENTYKHEKSEMLYMNGCYSSLYKLMYFYTVVLFITVVITEGFFLLSIILSYFLHRALKRRKQHLVPYLQNIKDDLSYDNPHVEASAPTPDPISNDNYVLNTHPAPDYMDYNNQRLTSNYWTLGQYNHALYNPTAPAPAALSKWNPNSYSRAY